MSRTVCIPLCCAFTIFAGLVAASPMLACHGASCHGRDPEDAGCTARIHDGEVVEKPGLLRVKIRKSAGCVGAKWAWAEQYGDARGNPLAVWLETGNGDVLVSTLYKSTDEDQVFGDMWSGSVKACARSGPEGDPRSTVLCTNIDA